MPRLRQGGLWLAGSIVFTAAAIVSLLLLTDLGHQVASHVAATGVSATAATIGAVSTAYNTFRRPRAQNALPKPRRSSLVTVCYVRDDTRWGQWCEDRLKAAGFQARLQQFPSLEGGAAAAEWVKQVTVGAKCTLVIESEWLRRAGDTVAQRVEALDRHRLGGHRVVYVVTDAQTARLAPIQARTSLVFGIRQEGDAWRLIEDSVRRSGVRSDGRRAREHRTVGTPSFPGSGATRANLPPITPNFVGRSTRTPAVGVPACSETGRREGPVRGRLLDGRDGQDATRREVRQRATGIRDGLVDPGAPEFRAQRRSELAGPRTGRARRRRSEGTAPPAVGQAEGRGPLAAGLRRRGVRRQTGRRHPRPATGRC